MSDLIEAMARAICGNSAEGYCKFVGGDLGCKRGRGESYNGHNCVATRAALNLTTHWDEAKGALQALSAAGWDVVPREGNYEVNAEAVIELIKAYPEMIAANLEKNNALWRALSALNKVTP